MRSGPFRRTAPFHSDFGLCDKPSPHDVAKSLSRMRSHCVSQARKIPFAGEPRQELVAEAVAWMRDCQRATFVGRRSASSACLDKKQPSPYAAERRTTKVEQQRSNNNGRTTKVEQHSLRKLNICKASKSRWLLGQRKVRDTLGLIACWLLHSLQTLLLFARGSKMVRD